MGDVTRRDWQYDFVLEDATRAEADALWDQIHEYAEGSDLYAGGGYHPIKDKVEVDNGTAQDGQEVQDTR